MGGVLVVAQPVRGCDAENHAAITQLTISYLVWKLIHIASVIIFVGNITTGLFWAAHSHRTRNFSLIAPAFEGIIRSDRWFTIPGVIGILIGGFAAAIDGNLPILATGWILWPIILFSISGIAFGAWVEPLQRRIEAFQQFGGKLMPILEDIGVEGQPEVYPAHTFVTA